MLLNVKNLLLLSREEDSREENCEENERRHSHCCGFVFLFFGFILEKEETERTAICVFEFSWLLGSYRKCVVLCFVLFGDSTATYEE